MIKRFILCSILIANNGVSAISTLKKVLIGTGVYVATCYYLATETALSDWLSSRVHVQDDAEFMEISSRELEYFKDFDYLLANRDNMDQAMEVMEGRGSLHNDHVRALNVHPGRVACLLKYKPEYDTPEIINQREKLLQMQKDLEFLVVWVTKSRVFCMQEARWMRLSYGAKISQFGDRAKLRRIVYDDVLNRRRACCLQQDYDLLDYLKDLQSRRTRLQKAIDLFLKANWHIVQDRKAASWNLVPESVQKLADDLAKLQEIVTADSNLPLVPNWTTPERLLLDQETGRIWQDYLQELIACDDYRIENALYHDRKISEAIQAHMVNLHKKGLLKDKSDFLGYENLLLQDRARLQAAWDQFLAVNKDCSVPWSISKLLNNDRWDKTGLNKIQEVLLNLGS